ncbi:hypothetical protein SDC9_141141 [bioreactor metagenome]|uniref:Uncharacterized protein n=1 Tax=bioreactor metagenome TaxID=1076179 RepID=A0A645DXK3_9ZZZZ
MRGVADHGGRGGRQLGTKRQGVALFKHPAAGGPYQVFITVPGGRVGDEPLPDAGRIPPRRERAALAVP